MASVVPNPMINAKLYKNFAAITCAITVCVAVMADGEAQEAVVSHAKERQQAAQLREADAKRNGVLKIGKVRPRSSGGFGEEFDRGYGAGHDVPSSSANSSFSGEGFIESEPAEPLPNLTQAQYEALTPEERAAYEAKVRKRQSAKQRKAGPTPDQIEALARASAARSGSSEIE